MIKKVLFFLTISLLFGVKMDALKSCAPLSGYGAEEYLTPEYEAVGEYMDLINSVLRVPIDFPSIAAAVENSREGDWIIISPGTYYENEIEINKAITISSEWKLSNDEAKIAETIIDSEDKILFTINTEGVEISGLKLINGNHTLNIEERATIVNNHFLNNLDGMSFESNGGGYVAYNTAENDRDDALDLDIISDDGNSGSDILIEHNVFINSNDDGIEIRLFKPLNQDVKYTIRQNKIMGSKNAAVQLISYDEFTGKEFHIYHNIFLNCKTGLGCMEGAQTRENLSGAKKMDEKVYFYNNTVAGCQMGATGGNRIIAFNNLIVHNSLGGYKMFGENSVIRNNLFFDNGGDDLISINPRVVQDGNIFETNPLIDSKTYSPARNSVCIDGGIVAVTTDGKQDLAISPDLITGEVPDIGAIERGLRMRSIQKPLLLQVDAGEDRVVESFSSPVVLSAEIRNADGRSFKCAWKQVKGPLRSEITHSDQLIANAKLARKGIYQFSIDCSDGQVAASDMVTIRYINEGEGNNVFLSKDIINTIEAEDFAYAFGNVNVVRKKFLRLKPSAQLEFSIGMAERNEYDIWLLIKSLNHGVNKIEVEFNELVVGEVSPVNDKKLHWVKVPVKIKTTPGQWQLLISNLNGKILLDKIIFSTDNGFVPH